jgi:hypothetical protein
MRVLIFSTTFVWNISHCKKNTARYYPNVHTSSYECPLFLSGFNVTWIFSAYFRNKIEFHETPSIASRVVPCRETWRSWQSLFASLRKLLTKLYWKVNSLQSQKRCTVWVAHTVFLGYVYKYLIGWLCGPNCEIRNAQRILVRNPLLNAVTYGGRKISEVISFVGCGVVLCGTQAQNSTMSRHRRPSFEDSIIL